MNGHLNCVIATALCLFLPALPAEAEIDRERMQQDLDIMEGILQNLHAQTTSKLVGVHREPQVRGLYFENYGVIFLIEERGPAVYSPPGLGFPAQLTKVFEMHTEGDVATKFKEQVQKRRTDIQNRLAEFLGTFADAIRQLKDADRISILVFFQRLSPYGFDLERAGVGEPEWLWPSQSVPRHRSPTSQDVFDPDKRDSIASRGKRSQDSDKLLYTVTSEQVYLEVTAKKRDIVAYRREQIDEADFRKRIVSREHTPDASTTKKIGVMAAIMDQTLKQNEHRFPYSNKTLGIYQEGLGALFFVKVQSTYQKEILYAIVKETRLRSLRRRSSHAAKARNPSVNRLKDDLVEAVADYGFSLRTLKPDEYIVVDVRFPKGMRRKPSDPRGLVLTVQKKSVDAYSRGDLDLDAFRQRADIREY